MKTKEINGSLFLIDEDVVQEITRVERDWYYDEDTNNITKFNLIDSSKRKVIAQQFIEGKTDYIVDTLFEVVVKEDKTIEYWKNNAEEKYHITPISVLRYITILEKLNQQHEREVEFVMEEYDKGGVSYAYTEQIKIKIINGKEYKCFTIKYK